MISPYKITFRGLSSLDFDCYVGLSFDGDNGEVSAFLGKEAVYSEVYNGSRRNVYGYKNNEVLTPKITFVKKDYSDFTPIENRKILAWLTGSQTASWLSVYADKSEVIEYELLGNFISCSQYKLGNGRVVGYVCEFESISPHAYSPINTITRTITAPTTLTINCQSDEQSAYTYPKITIEEDFTSVVVNITSSMASSILNSANYIEGTVYNDGTNYYWKKDGVNYGPLPSNTSGINTTSVSIWNKTVTIKSNATVIKNRVRGEKIVIDGTNEIISTGTTAVIGDNFNWNWMPLAIGDNTIEIIGNCKVTFEYREIMKVGDL